MSYGLTLVTPPEAAPVTAAEAKAHAEYEDTDRDAWFEDAVKAASRLVEAHTGRSLLTQTWRYTASRFPGYGRTLRLPRAAPLQSVTGVQYYDNDVLTTLATTGYGVLTDTEPGEIYLPDGESWPTPDARPDAVRVVYVAGWADAALVPAEIRQAVLMTVADWFMNRERPEGLPGAAKALLGAADLALYV